MISLLYRSSKIQWESSSSLSCSRNAESPIPTLLDMCGCGERRSASSWVLSPITGSDAQMELIYLSGPCPQAAALPKMRTTCLSKPPEGTLESPPALVFPLNSHGGRMPGRGSICLWVKSLSAFIFGWHHSGQALTTFPIFQKGRGHTGTNTANPRPRSLGGSQMAA